MKYERKYFFLPLILAAAGLLFMACPADPGDTTPAKEMYTVTFDLGYTGGTVPDPINVEKGQAAESAFPADPVRAEYLFSGWYEGQVKYTKYTVITKAVTLTAQWEAQHTVTFAIGWDGGTTPDPIVLKTGQSGGILFPPDPVRFDWLFKEWVDAQNNKYDAATPVTQSVTLTAQWFQGYRVTMAVVGGMAVIDPPYIDVERNQSMGSLFPAAPQLPEKFTFDGWYSGETQYNTATAITGDVTLTGKWSKAANVDRITARNAGNPVFKFTVPEGDAFGNYTKITAKFLVNDENKSTATPVIRLYGSYLATDFTDTGARYWKGPPGSYLQFNNQFSPAGNIIPIKYQWYTLEIPFDSTKFHEADFNARFPGAAATGDFYFALGLSLGGGTASAVPVTSYMTDVTLSNADGSKKIVSPGGGFSKPAMIGNANGDVNDDGSNTGDISRK
jgi:uncharacterized repeat protein (TIGR02543 family)